MAKQYFLTIYWYDYLIYALYNIIFSYLLTSAGEVFFNINKQTRLVLLVIFQLYFFVFIADSFLNFLPLIHDSNYYSSIITSGLYPQHFHANIIVFYYLLLLIKILCLNSPVIFTFFCMFIFIISVQILLKAWNFSNPSMYEARQNTLFAWMVLFSPACMLFSCCPSRSVFTLLSFSIFLYGIVKYKQQKVKNIVIIGSLLMISIDFKMLFFIAPFMLFYILVKSKLSLAYKYIISICLLFTAFIICTVVFDFSPASFSLSINTSLQTSAPYSYGNVSWVTYMDMFKGYIFLTLQFIAAPLPVFIMHNPLSTLMLFADFIYFIFILIICILFVKKLIKSYAFFILIAVCWILTLGCTEHNLYDAVQDRIPMFLLITLFASSAIISKLNPQND